MVISHARALTYIQHIQKKQRRKRRPAQLLKQAILYKRRQIGAKTQELKVSIATPNSTSEA